ncbi:hypothetical protein OAF37_02835 [Rubripirellula sp.]|nr:hypothetical protein [Rubripirellula sp.]
MSPARLALVANGSIIIAAALLILLFDARFVWLLAFMGCSLIFSGWSDFCGFAVIFRRWGRK